MADKKVVWAKSIVFACKMLYNWFWIDSNIKKNSKIWLGFFVGSSQNLAMKKKVFCVYDFEEEKNASFLFAKLFLKFSIFQNFCTFNHMVVLTKWANRYHLLLPHQHSISLVRADQTQTSIDKEKIAIFDRFWVAQASSTFSLWLSTMKSGVATRQILANMTAKLFIL